MNRILAAISLLLLLAFLATRQREEAWGRWQEPDEVQPGDPLLLGYITELEAAHDRAAETRLDDTYGPWVGPWPPATVSPN